MLFFQKQYKCSSPVDGVKKNSSLLGKPVDLAGLVVTDLRVVFHIKKEDTALLIRN